MSMDCVFCKIVSKEIPAAVVAETPHVLAFKNIKPVADVHVLIVPKQHIEEFIKLERNHYHIWNEIHEVAKDIIRSTGIADKGYRLTLNGGGANEIWHLHMHVIGPVERERGL